MNTVDKIEKPFYMVSYSLCCIEYSYPFIEIQVVILFGFLL